ncbi:MAG TPA: phosphoribosyltransferase family protein [Pyrinomonadaceae bacterium]|jgi:orotate phosphoribosyltransferase
MTAVDVTALFLGLVEGRHGHFGLESGYHGRLWFDLDPLFAEPRRVEPFVGALAASLRQYGVEAVCGPLLGGAFLAQLVAHALGAEFHFTRRGDEAEAGKLYGASYRLPAALRERVKGKRVAVVDDVMSAGSSLRATFEELRAHGAEVPVAGALLVLGTRGADFFAAHGVAVEAVARDAYQTWEPTRCPLCAAGVPLEDTAAPPA